MLFKNSTLQFVASFLLLFLGNLVGYSLKLDVCVVNLLVALVCFVAFAPCGVRCVWLGCGVAIASVLLCLLGVGGKFFAVYMWVAFLGGSVWISKDFSTKNLSLLLVLGAVFFNLNFISTTWWNWVQYDILSCYNYIEYIIDNNFMFWRENPLISRPSYSAYHPILHFFVAGLGIKSAEVLSGSIEVAKEVVQILFCFYLFAFYVYANRIIALFGFDKLVHLSVLALVCFFPIFNAMAGYFNNDGLLLALQGASVYYALAYYMEEKKSDLWKLVACVVGACLTKLSGVVVLPMIGVIFLIKLWQKREWKRFCELFSAGVVILIGVALWPLYQHFVLGVDYNYVPPQAHLSLMEYSYWERFNPVKAIFYGKMFYDDFGINLWETMTKTAIFGQWNFEVKAKDVFALVVITEFCYKFLVGVLIVGGAWLLLKKRDVKLYLVYVLMAGILVAHVVFGIMHPYMCNMDFRYVAILILPMAIVLGYVMSELKFSYRVAITAIISALTLSSAIVWWYIVL